MLVWSKRIIGEFVHMKEPLWVRTASRNWLQPKFSNLYCLKTPTQSTCDACFPLVTAYTHTMLVFHWPWFTPTQCLFSIGLSLNLRISCFRESFCWFYPWPDVSVHNIRQVHHKSRWYITISLYLSSYISSHISSHKPLLISLDISLHISIHIS